MFVLTAILAVLLLVLFTSPALHAADDQIHFTGNNLSYQGNQYVDAGKAQAGNSANIPDGSEYFTFNEPLGSPTATPKTDIIYFAAGKTPTDETKATFVTYNTNPSSSPPSYSNPSNQKDVTVETANQGTDGGSSCAINGIGWIVCPISNALAGGMDWFMGALGNFVKVQPLNVTDSHNDLYVAWNIMRSIANVAFIVVFLIIIYSQLTSFGVSNYGLKKLMPRLIVGVIIVNLSYFICAAILDASNILGSSLQDVLISMRTTVFNATGSNASIANGDFTNITTSVLSGGTVAAGLTVGGVAVNSALIGGTFVGLWYLLVPALIALLLAIMVVVLILATRQALIIILIVISPLAFVAYLLPNTEKWFKSWQKTFTTMMVFYPAFSIVLGGAQLASAVIVKNATSMTVVVLGLIVQVAPLAITPWLLRLSGSTIQSVAKFAQGFNKRINGAANNWAKPRREVARLRGLSTPSRNPMSLRRNAQYWSSRGQRVKDRTAAYTIGAENMHRDTKRFAVVDTQRRGYEKQKGILDKQYETTWKNFERTNSGAAAQDTRMRLMTDKEEFAGQRLDARYEEIRATGRYSYAPGQKPRVDLDAIAKDAQVAHSDVAIQGIRIQNAKRVQEGHFADAMKKSTVMQREAGGINTKHDAGANAAIANAVSTMNKAGADNMAAADTVVSSYQLTTTELATLAEVGSVTNTKGETLSGDLFQQSAFNTLSKVGIAPFLSSTLQKTHGMDEEKRAAFKGSLDSNHSTVKNVMLWGVDDGVKQMILNGTPITKDTIYGVLNAQFKGDKVSRELLSTQDESTLKDIYQGVVDGKIDRTSVKKLVGEVAKDDDLQKKMKENARIQIARINALL